MTNSQLDALFEEMDRDGAVCVMELHGDRELMYHADELMDTGSAFKIAIALEVCCQIAEGERDPGQWIRIDAEKAPTGRGTIAQALELMMSLSDNAAANALLHLAGYERITASPPWDCARPRYAAISRRRWRRASMPCSPLRTQLATTTGSP